ncbi:aKG-HExxH-type peptide beta-hydroxylase [Streptomyces luteolus]|uniref:HEXXH motif-containing putative peptide modification protein n=1 Tax=Streptomyces luteolus TaxID=3043615 RepID=A0ABT6SXU6_9ACTN|nr:HEXXH motif-containing putative peptide modification protein [Streptomyces sp. B-S-A12]MDI3420437.1 HEXXH motif-containing putative peptide modification protein [Streptomyces sp. B-S-A12]
MSIVQHNADLLFQARPEATRVQALRYHVNETLVRDLGQYIAAASSLLPRTSAAASRTVRQVVLGHRVNPQLFTLHWLLGGALRTQQPGGVLLALGQLAHMRDRGDCYRQTLAIDTVAWDLIDVEASAFLLSKDGPRSKRGEVVEIAKVSAEELSEGRLRIDDALSVLRVIDPAMHAEFDELVATVRLFNRGTITGSTTTGISSLRYWGQMYLRYPDPGERGDWTAFLLEHLVHESSHILLHGIMGRDALLTNGFKTRHQAPIRNDRRPLYGVYHAMFVLSRVYRVLSRYADSGATSTARAARDLALKRFLHGYDTVMNHAELTPAGRAVAESCKELVAAQR